MSKKTAVSKIAYNYEPLIQLNKEQLQAKELIKKQDITILYGKAGSGKTAVAVETALDLLRNKSNGYKQIVLTRPYIQTEEYGLLPGTLQEKLDPNYEVLKIVFSRIIGKQKTDLLFQDESIYILPVGFSRGITIEDSIIINDEAQNYTVKQALMVATRLGKGSKMIFTLDADQIDIKERESCVLFMKAIGEIKEKVGVMELLENHRNPLITEIIDIYNRKFKGN